MVVVLNHLAVSVGLQCHCNGFLHWQSLQEGGKMSETWVLEEQGASHFRAVETGITGRGREQEGERKGGREEGRKEGREREGGRKEGSRREGEEGRMLL